jgi:hypothetical protein
MTTVFLFTELLGVCVFPWVEDNSLHLPFHLQLSNVFGHELLNLKHSHNL